MSVNAREEGGLAGSICAMGPVAVTIATAPGDLAVELDPTGAGNFRLLDKTPKRSGAPQWPFDSQPFQPARQQNDRCQSGRWSTDMWLS
jgi:hypothetical protein